MKKPIFAVMLLILILVFAPQAAAYWVEGDAAILLDVDTGKVLYSQNAHYELPAASTVQIMTALVAIEHGDLQQVIKMPTDYTASGDNAIYLTVGEEQTLEDLLYAMLLRTAEDAAYAIAVGLAGSEDKFVSWMNEKALQMGLEDSNFTNVNGKYDANDYTSAHDLALITKEAFKYDIFNQIIQTKKWEIPWAGSDTDRLIYNKNQFFSYCAEADGVKMGNNADAGTCLVASATYDGHRLIGVILKSDSIYKEMTAMIDFARSKYVWKRVGVAGELASTLTVYKGWDKSVKVIYPKDYYLIFEKNKGEDLQGVLNLPQSVIAEVAAGQVLGTIDYQFQSGEVQSFNLTAASTVSKYTFWGVFTSVLQRIFGVFL